LSFVLILYLFELAGRKNHNFMLINQTNFNKNLRNVLRKLEYEVDFLIKKKLLRLFLRNRQWNILSLNFWPPKLIFGYRR